MADSTHSTSAPLFARARRGPFHRFFQTEAAGGSVLLLCALAALVVANSPWADAYHSALRTPVTIQLGERALVLSLRAWINDGLMAIFFLLVGLEIKRELIAGELASPRQAALPIAGAVGGMLLPAALYTVITVGTTGARGWGIPMATDIAFALGTLSLIAPHAPTGAKVFLTALAIVDDMGAVLVIALFYSGAVGWSALAAAVLVFICLVGLNRLGVRHLVPYLLLGAALWLFVHASGVHATVAGVLLAFTIPTLTRMNAVEFSQRARSLIDEFDRTETGDLVVLTSKGQQEALLALERASEHVTAPLLRLEHALHPFSAYVVMPLFAFANAGVELTTSAVDGRVAAGVIAGLLVGKPLGIMAASYASVRLGWAALPEHVTWGILHACAWLGGVGFTMSLFIATLAFPEAPQLDAAKLGIFGGSAAAAIVAFGVTRRRR